MPQKVMVVDDSTDVREALADLLEQAGHEVLQFENGLRALEHLRSGGVRPTLILLDLMMPVMDGYTFRVEQLRDPALRAIPVIFTTAFWEGNDIAGAPVLPKPIDLEAVLRLLDRMPPPPERPVVEPVVASAAVRH